MTLPTAVGQETVCPVDEMLTNLNLSGNSLAQTIGDIIKFHRLTHLYLRETNTMNASEVLLELKQLEHADFSENFMEEISAAGNSNLKSIDLSNCKLKKMGHMANCSYFDLRGNVFQDRQGLPRHSGMTYLDIRDAMAANNETGVCDAYGVRVDCYEE